MSEKYQAGGTEEQSMGHIAQGGFDPACHRKGQSPWDRSGNCGQQGWENANENEESSPCRRKSAWQKTPTEEEPAQCCYGRQGAPEIVEHFPEAKRRYAFLGYNGSG